MVADNTRKLLIPSLTILARLLRFHVGVPGDVEMQTAEVYQPLAVAVANRLEHRMMFALRVAEVLRPHDRIRPDDVGLVAEVLDRRRQIRISAGGEEAPVKAEVGPEDSLRVADLHSVIVLALRR